MMTTMKIDDAPTPTELKPKLERVFELAVEKIASIDRTWDASRGTPVFTLEGRYATRGWTEWTQGFQYGAALLAYDATGDEAMLRLGRDRTLERMAPHLTHIGVHDHGFNNVSTYGNLRRLAREGRLSIDDAEMQLYELALKVSGAVQAARWTSIVDEASGRREAGFVHSFNGPHSLFSDTIRSMRSLVLAHQLGHVLMAENDEPICLLGRAMAHAEATARYNVYYGEGRDAYDTPGEAGRVVHESIFNVTDGRYRCPSTQQGYSPFSTWTRGLAWVLCGFAEQIEMIRTVGPTLTDRVEEMNGHAERFERAARATAAWYLGHSFADGMVYWDSGAPGIPRDVDYAAPSDPYNDHEPIDSSATGCSASTTSGVSSSRSSRRCAGPWDSASCATTRVVRFRCDDA